MKAKLKKQIKKTDMKKIEQKVLQELGVNEACQISPLENAEREGFRRGVDAERRDQLANRRELLRGVGDVFVHLGSLFRSI